MKRKGVSPVIATLLLIVVAVAAAVLTYIWVTGYMGRVTGTVEQTSMEQLQERIKINAVNVSDDTVTIYVTNIGEVNTVISAGYILTEGGTAVCNTTDNTPLNAGQTANVQLTNCGLQPGKTYIAKAVTSKGTEATYTFTAP